MCLFLVKNEGNIDIITLHGHGTFFAVNNGTKMTHKSKDEIVHKFTVLACICHAVLYCSSIDCITV